MHFQKNLKEWFTIQIKINEQYLQQAVFEKSLQLAVLFVASSDFPVLTAYYHDYLTDGFWAMSREQELPCKDLTVTFIDQILDVTSYVQDRLKKDEDPEGLNYLSPKYLKTVADKFAKENKVELTPATVLELKAFYGGNKYYLFIKTVYKDIRMVGAPPSSIGKFGADTDNWMWPRQTGDFSMFRIYADKNGKSAEYSKDNVPLKVKKYFKLNISGVKEKDYVMTMGFPGSNWRYMSIAHTI